MRIQPRAALALLSTVLVVLMCGGLNASSVRHQNIVDLINLSEIIAAGEVTSVTDGFDQDGVPYSEVTLKLREVIRGDLDVTYTFRQFGLQAPRVMPDGRVSLNVTLDGWPSFKQGEDAVVFLYQASALTKLRTTVGLLQGKFNVEDGKLFNEINNLGLFQGVQVDPSVLTDEEQKMLNSREGAVHQGLFLSFVRKAVENQWIELGRMSNGNR